MKMTGWGVPGPHGEPIFLRNIQVLLLSCSSGILLAIFLTD